MEEVRNLREARDWFLANSGSDGVKCIDEIHTLECYSYPDAERFYGAKEKKPKISKEAKEFEEEINRVTHDLYVAYGSGTGVLFGIPSSLKSAVRTIVQVIISNRISKQKVTNALNDIEANLEECTQERLSNNIEVKRKELGLK